MREVKIQNPYQKNVKSSAQALGNVSPQRPSTAFCCAFFDFGMILQGVASEAEVVVGVIQKRAYMLNPITVANLPVYPVKCLLRECVNGLHCRREMIHEQHQIRIEQAHTLTSMHAVKFTEIISS